MMPEPNAAMIREALARALYELRAQFERDGLPLSAIGLSVFAISGEPTGVMQFSAFEGDLHELGMFAPEWPWHLSRDLLDNGPTEAFEGAAGGDGQDGR